MIESFEESLPEPFDPNQFRRATLEQLLQEYQGTQFGHFVEDYGTLTGLVEDPEDFDCLEMAAVLLEEAIEVDKMHDKGWTLEAADDEWCSAEIDLKTEPNGSVKVYQIPDFVGAAAVELVNGQFHCLRPRTDEDDRVHGKLEPGDEDDDLDAEEEEFYEDAEDDEEEESEDEDDKYVDEDEFDFVESVDDELPAMFSPDSYRMMTEEELQEEYDTVVFGSDLFNYGLVFDDGELPDLPTVAEMLRARSAELSKLHGMGWMPESIDGQWMTASVPLFNS